MLWSSRNLRGGLKTESPLWHLSTEFYYCFEPDGCQDKGRSPFKSYNGCNLISGQQNCHEQRTLIVPFLFFPFSLQSVSLTSLATPHINSPLRRWCPQSKHKGAGEVPRLPRPLLRPQLLRADCLLSTRLHQSFNSSRGEKFPTGTFSPEGRWVFNPSSLTSVIHFQTDLFFYAVSHISFISVFRGT